MTTTVLLADDDARFRSLVRAVLVEDGYVVVGEAGDAATALALARQHSPDAIVADLVLPGASGLSLVRDLLAARPGASVLVVSSLFDPTLEQEVEALGATYVDKTDGLVALEEAIDALVADPSA